MRDSLFRQEAIDARRGDWLGAIQIGTPRYGRALNALALGAIAGIAALLLCGEYTRHERVSGELIPSHGLLAIAAPADGVLAQCFVSEGAAVSEGQALAEIRIDLDSAALGDTRAAIAGDLALQRARLQADLADEDKLLADRIAALREQEDLLQNQGRLLDESQALKQQHSTATDALLERLRPLRDKGVLGVFEFDEREAAAIAARADLQQARIQRLDIDRQLQSVAEQRKRAPLDACARRNDIERRLADVSQAIARNEGQRAVVLRAPRAGTVSAVATAVGQTVGNGQRLMSIAPTGSILQAQLWLPGRAIGAVATGDRVVLRYHAYPYQKFGEQSGHVLEVSGSALAPAEFARLTGRTAVQPLYRVVVALDRQALSVAGGSAPLKASMDLDADVLLERRRLIHWAIDPLFAKKPPPSTGGDTL